MIHKTAKKKEARKRLANVKKEMAKPRMARSARIEELNLDSTRVREQPSTTVPGTVDKIVCTPGVSNPEKAQISVDGAKPKYRHLQIENTLTDEHGDDVKLKKGAHVDVTVTDHSRA